MTTSKAGWVTKQIIESMIETYTDEQIVDYVLDLMAKIDELERIVNEYRNAILKRTP
jgi:hypothetical protein